MKSIYDISIDTIEGTPLDWSKFKDKWILLVNVASECGFTPQYEQLQELHEAAGDKLGIIGVPCNDFGGQEPGTETEIKAFCTKRYGVTFTLTEKISLYNPMHPLYEWLTQKEYNGVSDAVVKWNFTKFLIDPKGRWQAVYPSAVSPLDETILQTIGL